MGQDARAQFLGVLTRRQPLYQRQIAAVAHGGPTGCGVKLADIDSGLFHEFAAEIAAEIAGTAGVDIIGLGRAAWEAKLRRSRRVGRHLADQISAVGGAQRRSRKEIVDAAVGETPSPPGDKARQ